MDDRLQDLLDHHEIRKTLSEYCHGCDRCDERSMGSVYLEDSFDDHGTVKASGPEYTRIMSAIIKESTITMYHLLGQSIIKVTGDEAGAETYFIACAQVRDEDGAVTTNQQGGRFVDRLQRVKGRWLIEHRIVVSDWTLSFPGQPRWVDADPVTPGQRSNADPAFAVLGRVHSGG